MAGEEKVEKSNILMYTTEDGVTKVEVTFDNDTVWLSLDQIADLFQRNKSTISRHIKNIFLEGELSRNSVVANFATTGSDGKRYHVDFYNLDVIISVGYRVKSLRGTQFRIWATNILKEYMIKGFALDDERLKNLGGGNYFDELLARIRDIRSSEKVFWRKVLEIYATSIDYNPKAESSVQFFKQVQNKMHWAAHKHTVAEVIYQTLAYNGLSFSVPKRLHIIGMMNTADRSLAMIDYALRRRFSFFDMEPGFDSEGFINYQKGFANDTFNTLIERIKELNKEIMRDKSLGKGFCIGHSYFCNADDCSEEWMKDVVDFDILPMLSEYWFDESDKLQRWENILHGVFQ